MNEENEERLLKKKKLKSLFIMTLLKALWSTGKRKLATVIASIAMGGTTIITNVDSPMPSLKECSIIVNDLGDGKTLIDDKMYEEYMLNPVNRDKIKHCIDEINNR